MANKHDAPDHLMLEELWEEPLPEWATGLNPEKELRVGTQLCTRDGRRMGNARIMRVGTLSKEIDTPLYVCETDRRNRIRLVAEEVHELFHIGDYFVNTED